MGQSGIESLEGRLRAVRVGSVQELQVAAVAAARGGLQGLSSWEERLRWVRLPARGGAPLSCCGRPSCATASCEAAGRVHPPPLPRPVARPSISALCWLHLPRQPVHSCSWAPLIHQTPTHPPTHHHPQGVWQRAAEPDAAHGGRHRGVRQHHAP